MRAPRWFSRFNEWRWAPCVALIAGSLAFIALALLLIPLRFDAPARVATERSPDALSGPAQRTLSAALPAPRAVANAPALARDVAPLTPIALPAPAPAPPPAPTPVPDEAPPGAPSMPDFSANIADRGDRPLAPPRARRQGE